MHSGAALWTTPDVGPRAGLKNGSMDRLSHVACCVVALLFVVAPVTAAARPAPISGTLSTSGYTVIALAANGKATSVRARGGGFSLRPPASRVTLQLRAPNGVYAGPIVIGSDRHGAHAIVGVTAGARLGRITVNTRRGYSKVARRVAARWVDTSRWARARKGVPIGAGNFGRVRSKPPRVSPPGDLDVDGVPDRLDVDINGNLILNNVDRSKSSRAQAAQTASAVFTTTSLFGGWYGQAVNANAREVTDADIDRSLATNQHLTLGILPGNPELDCGGAPDPNNPQGWIGGLSYCRRGGTGAASLSPAQVATPSPFPACCDADGNGYGALVNNTGFPPPGTFSLTPNATSSQIGTGDVLIQRVTSNGVSTDTPTLLPFVFATTLGLASYDDGQGNATSVKYPVDTSTGLGAHGNGFRVAAGPDGDVALTLSFWRPQRRPMPPEPGAWTDIGKLSYGASIFSAGTTNVQAPSKTCPQSAYSANDPNLSVAQKTPGDPGAVTDLAGDQPANPVNTITYTLNASKCLASFGLAWNPGDEAVIHFWANDGFGSGASSGTDMWAMFTRR